MIQLSNYLLLKQLQRTVVEPADGTGFSAYTSGGTAKHTTLVLNDVQGEFVGGETITASSSNSRTGTVQFDSIGCKGFETKDLIKQKVFLWQVVHYTANTSLTSTFGDVKNFIRINNNSKS